MTETTQTHLIGKKQKITFNALGTKFQITKDAFEQMPNHTRLGILKNYEKMDTEKILSYCDDYDPMAVEFFFNREPEILKLVLNQALTGNFHTKTNLCEVYLKSEFDYWKLHCDDLHDCCVSSFAENYENKVDIMKAEQHLITKWKARDQKEQNTRQKLWYILSNPRHSALAMVIKLPTKLFNWGC